MKKENTVFGISARTCQERCKNKQDCQWHTYNKRMELCIHFQSCKTRSLIKEYNQIEYISGQSECPYEVDIPKVENPAVDNSEVDNPEVDNPEVDKSKVDNPFVGPYQCNMTGMCIVSHKHRVQNHNIGKYSNILISLCLKAFPIILLTFLTGKLTRNYNRNRYR